MSRRPLSLAREGGGAAVLALLEHALAGAVLARDWRAVALLMRTWAELEAGDGPAPVAAGSPEERVELLESLLEAARSGQKGTR